MAERLRRTWKIIASILAIKVEIPYQLRFSDNSEIVVDACVRNFGGANGMLLVSDYSLIREKTLEIVAMGYGYSCLSEPESTEVVESAVDDIKEMLNEWTYSGKSKEKPDWVL